MYIYIGIKGKKFHLCRFNIKIQVNSRRNNKSLIIPVSIGKVNIFIMEVNLHYILETTIEPVERNQRNKIIGYL